MITTIYPSQESIEKLREHVIIVTQKTGIKIRMVKVVLHDGEVEVLLTNLYDDKIFTLKKLSDLYFMRWKIEPLIANKRINCKWKYSVGIE